MQRLPTKVIGLANGLCRELRTRNIDEGVRTTSGERDHLGIDGGVREFMALHRENLRVRAVAQLSPDPTDIIFATIGSAARAPPAYACHNSGCGEPIHDGSSFHGRYLPVFGLLLVAPFPVKPVRR